MRLPLRRYCALAIVMILSGFSRGDCAGVVPDEMSGMTISGNDVRIQLAGERFSYDLDNSRSNLSTRVIIHNCRLAPGVGQVIHSPTSIIADLKADQVGGDVIVTLLTTTPTEITVRRDHRSVVISAGLQGTSPAGNVDAENAKFNPLRHRVVLRLKYAGVAEVADALVANAQLTANDGLPSIPNGVSGGNGGLSGLPTQPALTPVGEREALPAEHVSSEISIDRRLNAVIISGTEDEIRDIEQTISQIDLPVPSVMIDAEIIELTDDGARDLGVDFSSVGSAGSASIGVHNLSVPTSSASFQATLYAEIQKGRGRILARPRIATQSSVPAYIQTGDAIPVITSITYPGATAVTQQQVQYVNVGVTLAIRPRVGPDGIVAVNVAATVSSVTGYVQSAPELSERTVTAIANVQNERVFVLGGLVQESAITQVASVPLLGSLPLIGKLFSVEHSTMSRTNLYIAITPHIIDPAIVESTP